MSSLVWHTSSLQISRSSIAACRLIFLYLVSELLTSLWVNSAESAREKKPGNEGLIARSFHVPVFVLFVSDPKSC